MLVQSSSCILISSEIQEEFLWPFRQFLNGMPAAFLSHEREAFYSRDGSDFRITLDDTILFRQEDLSLESDVYAGESTHGNQMHRQYPDTDGSCAFRRTHL